MNVNMSTNLRKRAFSKVLLKKSKICLRKLQRYSRCQVKVSQTKGLLMICLHDSQKKLSLMSS